MHKNTHNFKIIPFFSNFVGMKSFEKIDSLNQVAEFHRTFSAPILDTPQLISQERANLRVNLLQEELNEMKQAIADGNITEVADALADLQYVLSGAVLEFGLGEKFVTLFNEVHRSNMSKACSTEEEAQKTVAVYQQKGMESHIITKDNKFIVLRNDDKKVLKNVNYSPANLNAIISE